MAYAIEALIYNHFKGIREYNGVNSGGEISAIQCQNVELVQTELGAQTGIRSILGNRIAYSLPLGYEVKGLFKSQQENIKYTFIYAENTENGALFYINLSGNIEVLVDNLSVTGQCNGLTMSTTAYDVFVFTNGVETKTVCFTSDSGYENIIEGHNPVKLDFGYIADINAVDNENRAIKWLAMAEWNGFLVVGSEYGVHASHQNDIYTWNDNPQDIADAWHDDYSKKVTAIYAFTGGLYVFTADDCSWYNTTPNDTQNAIKKTAAGIGCFSYTSIIKHDLYLFFYDNNQRNIYQLSATDTTGQIRPIGPVAREIQSYFNNIDTFKMFSCVYETKNEVWCLIDNKIVIFDYARGEWITRKQQDIETLVLQNNVIYTGGKNGVIYAENINEDFAGVYYPSIYQTSFINVASNTNLKKQKTPLLLTLNANFTNNFLIQLTVDNKEKNPKTVKINKNSTGIFALENGETDDPRMKFGTAKFSAENTYDKTVVEISTPQTWYTMGVKIYTEKLGQGFFLTSMELKNTKVKTKTRGR